MARHQQVRLYLIGSLVEWSRRAHGWESREIEVMDRYKPIVVVIGLLFVVDIVCSLFAADVFKHSDSAQSNAGLALWIAIAVIMFVAAYWWSIRFPVSRVVAELLLVLAISCVLSVLIVPLFHGSSPFGSGAGFFFLEIWIFMGLGIGGAVLGWLTTIALGRDYRAKALARFTKVATAKPRRVVRR
jgi:hypothetical protein